MSRVVVDRADLTLANRRGLRSVSKWERHHGRLTAEELDKAECILDQAGVALLSSSARRRVQIIDI